MSDTKASAQLPATATAAVARGSKIDAIREVRAATGLGLLEAKQLVERYIAANPVLQEQFGQQEAALKRRVIRWVVVIDLLIFAVILWWFLGR
ncbi:MAG: ribosomal protein L7/L12 [Steroidobacteraceae bacterium]